MSQTMEETSRPAVEPVRLLTFVLNYDDLLAGSSASYRLDPRAPRVTLGRANDDRGAGLRGPSELRLDDRWASGQHCVLERRDGEDVLRDGGSRNGTWVNGARITELALDDGDLLEVGHSLLCYRVVDASLADALDRAAKLPPLGPTATLCPEFAALQADIAEIAPTREPVLILAETGTGKESTADAIHRQSGRRGAYCTVDCGAVPESLFESTFFGHRKGAFTGATDARAGEIQRADGGTLFLDEVANMGLAAQAKLLRVLEDGRVTPLGASRADSLDVRWIAATNRDLFAGDAPFRPDLLRRLAGYVARLPPLRRRREDLGTLSAHILREAGVTRASITVAAARKLFAGRLTGNIRQLRTALRTAAALAGDKAIDLAHLPPLDADAPVAEIAAPPPPRATGTPDAAAVEAALAATQGNVVQAASALSTHPRQLYRWIERYGLSLDKYRR